ncbi:MAG: arginase family protein [Planctomycetaceae bacterium]|jgi:arginase|nr:arginase family protein [Planctomycetaceae bacterium]
MLKNIFLSILLLLGAVSLNAQESKSNNIKNMENNTLRLIYPQWQGGIISSLLPELNPDDASKGYYLGAQLLNFLAPANTQKTIQVPVSLDINDRATEKGINSYRAILKQTKDALKILNENNPERVVILGGECSVSVVPFTYLASKYPNDAAVIWIDAHPDINLPGDVYEGYHAMALTACMGMGDEDLINTLPAKIDASKVLIVGVREWDKGMKERQKELGIKGLASSEVSENSSAVMEWLKNAGTSKVVIHFDLDVLDPSDLIAAVGVVPGGMKIDEVVRMINDISVEYDIVGLTIAEPMPRTAIKIRNMLKELPLLK